MESFSPGWGAINRTDVFQGSAPYKALFQVENEDTGLENTWFWNLNVKNKDVILAIARPLSDFTWSLLKALLTTLRLYGVAGGQAVRDLLRKPKFLHLHLKFVVVALSFPIRSTLATCNLED